MDTNFLYNSAVIADNIKSLAKERRISAKDMLSEIGLGASAVSHMRQGRMPSAENLAKIADYLDCSVDYLLGRINEPNLHPTGEIEQAFCAATPSIQDAIKKLLDIEHTKG